MPTDPTSEQLSPTMAIALGDTLDAALAEETLRLAQATRGGRTNDRAYYRDFASTYCTILARALLAERQARLEAERKLADPLQEIAAEVARAESLWPRMNSAHEGYAVILEELDELKAHVWMNQRRRDPAAMRKEAIQVAAMAVRFVKDVCDSGRHRE